MKRGIFWDQTLFCKNLKFHCQTPFLKTNIKPQLPVVNPWWRRMKKAVMWGQQCLLSRAVYPHQSCCCHMSPVLTPQKILSATFTQILGKVTRLRLYQRENLDSLEQDLLFYIFGHLYPQPSQLPYVANTNTTTTAALKKGRIELNLNMGDS